MSEGFMSIKRAVDTSQTPMFGPKEDPTEVRIESNKVEETPVVESTTPEVKVVKKKKKKKKTKEIVPKTEEILPKVVEEEEEDEDLPSVYEPVMEDGKVVTGNDELPVEKEKVEKEKVEE